MKAKHVILYLLLAIVSFSCIGEEALNAEADILSCALPGVAMTTSPIINNNSITIFVGPGTDISELTPEFTLTPGATINPLSRSYDVCKEHKDCTGKEFRRYTGRKEVLHICRTRRR